MRKHVVMDRLGNVVKIEDMPADVDAEAYMKQVLHDCPECRAAMERGEPPTLVLGHEIAARPAPRRRLFAKLPRWRTRKRR